MRSSADTSSSRLEAAWRPFEGFAHGKRIWLALTAAVATGTAASAQPVFRTALEIDNITVTARDAKGRLVAS